MPSPEAQQLFKLLDPSIEVSTESLSTLKKLLSEQPQAIKETCLVQLNRYDTRSTVNMSPLLYVMRENPNIDLINLLCDHGADASEYESYVAPELSQVLRYRDPRCSGYDYFIEHLGAKTHIKLQNPLLPNSNPVISELLPLLTTTLYSPLHYAILHDNTKLFFSLWERHKQAYLQKILQSNGASVSLLSVDTAVELTKLAILMGRVDITKVFIERGQFVKSDQIDVLVKAAIAHDQLEILKLLTGDDTDFKINDQTIGEIAVTITGNRLHGAVQIPYSQSKCLQYLLSRKFKTDGYFKTYEWLGKINLELFKALGEMCEVNQQLQNAIEEKSIPKVIKFFKTHTHERAIHLVISNNRLDDLKFLESCGALLTTNVALTHALAGHSDEILLYCLKKNADFNRGKISSENILNGAVDRDSSAFIQAVIDNPKIPRKQLKQLAKLAVELNAISVLKVLSQSGLVQDDQGKLTNIALKKQHEEVLEELLCHVEHSDQYFYTLLLSAIEHKDLELVRGLIQKVPVNLIQEHQLTPLQTAVLHYDQTIFDLILEETTDVNVFSKSNNPLILAMGITSAINDNLLHIVKALLLKGANPNKIERLNIASQEKIPFCKKQFTRLKEIKLHFKGSTFNTKAPKTNAFLLAVATFTAINLFENKSNTALFDLMLKHGADLTVVDGIGNSPLIILLASMKYQFKNAAALPTYLNLLPLLLRHDSSLLFKENTFSISALSLGKHLGEKYFKSILTTGFSITIEHHLKAEDYSAAKEIYQIMLGVEQKMGWDDLCTQVTSLSFCIISKHIQCIQMIKDHGVDASNLVIKHTLTSVRDTTAALRQDIPEKIDKMWANRKVQDIEHGRFKLEAPIRNLKEFFHQPLTSLMWALKHDKKDLFSALVSLNSESLEQRISFESTICKYRLCPTEQRLATSEKNIPKNSDLQSCNTTDLIDFLMMLLQTSPERDFSHYITVMLQHHKAFKPLNWQKMLTVILPFQPQKKHIKTIILDCINQLGNYLSYDTGIPNCDSQSVTIFAGAFGDSEIFDAIQQVTKPNILDLNYESQMHVSALTSAIDYCNNDTVRWLTFQLHLNNCFDPFSRYFKQTYLDAAYHKLLAAVAKEPNPSHLTIKAEFFHIFYCLLDLYLKLKPTPNAKVLNHPAMQEGCRQLIATPSLSSRFDQFIAQRQSSTTTHDIVEEGAQSIPHP